MSEIQPYSAADLSRLRSVNARPGGLSNRVRDQVREHRDERGHWVRVTRDQLGNLVRERWDGQDVKIILPLLRVNLPIREVR